MTSTSRSSENDNSLNDIKKNETPRFDLVNGIVQQLNNGIYDDDNAEVYEGQNIKRSQKNNYQRIFNDLEDSYQKATTEVSSLHKDMLEELDKLKRGSQN